MRKSIHFVTLLFGLLAGLCIPISVNAEAVLEYKFISNDGLTVEFTDKTEGSASRHWLYGDGKYDSYTQQIVTHTYDKPDTYLVTLLTNNITGAGNNITLEITVPPQVSFTSPSSHGSESLEYSDISVTLSAKSTQNVTVDWAIGSDPDPKNTAATLGDDYEFFPSNRRTLTFGPGEMRKTIRVLVKKDTDGTEGDETVWLTLSNVSTNAVLAAANKDTTFTIYDAPPRDVPGDFWADTVLGQINHTESTTNTVIRNHAFNVGGVVVDRSAGSGTRGRAYVWDGGNNRILGFKLDDCPYVPFPPVPGSGSACIPELVIGQPLSGWDNGSCNQDGSMFRYPYLAPASASTLCGTAAWYISPKEGARRASMAVDQITGDLYVPDYENHRVLIFNNPFTDITPTIADDVIGQDNFSGVYCNKTPYKRNSNYDGNTTLVNEDGTTFINEYGNTVPVDNPDRTSLCAQSDTLSHGFGVALDDARNLWVADGGNNRVLRFPRNSATDKISKSANLVLGQQGFTSLTSGSGSGPNTDGTNPTKMHGPNSLAFGPDGKLYVADGSSGVDSNSRILVFTPDINTGFTIGMEATLFSGGGETHGLTGTEFKLSRITGVSNVEGFNGLWVSSFVPYDDVKKLSQRHKVERFDWNDGINYGALLTPLPRWDQEGVKSNNFDGSIDVDKLGNVLVPGGRDTSDVVIYEASTNYSNKPATLLPKPFLHNITSDSHLFAPFGIATAKNQLYVSDTNRIMIWNNLNQLTDGKPADSFIGQFDFFEDDRDFNGDQPYFQMKIDSLERLWVASRNRIFVFQAPLYTWSKPIKVIQGPFPVQGTTTGETVDFEGVSAYREFGIAPMIVANPNPKPGDPEYLEFLWIGQPFDHRVLRIRDPLGSTPTVDMVLGQTTHLSGQCCNGIPKKDDPDNPGSQICITPEDQGYIAAPISNDSGIQTLDKLCYPYNLSIDKGNNLYVSDHFTEGAGNLRMLMFDASSFPTNDSDVIFGPTDPKYLAVKEFPKGQATFEAAFNTNVANDNINRMVVGYDSYGGDSPYVGIYEKPESPGVTTRTCSPSPTGTISENCTLNDHTLGAFAATFDVAGNLYVADANRTKVFIYKQPFLITEPPVGQTVYPAMTQVISQIAASSDDAFTCKDTTTTTTTTTNSFNYVGVVAGSNKDTPKECSIGSATTTGLRFRDINIPKDDAIVIDHAVIILKPTWTNPGEYVEALEVKINGVANANPPEFNTTMDLNSLPLLPVTVNLDDSNNGLWKNEQWHATPDLKKIVNEIIAQPDWVSGNAMTFVISNNGTPNERSFIAYDYDDHKYAPILYIQYHLDPSPPLVDLPPKITGFWPGVADPNSIIFVFGSGFDPTLGATKVAVNGLSAFSSIQDDETLLFFILPGENAVETYGPITVTTPSGTVTSTTNFNEPVNIASTGPIINGIWPGVAKLGKIVFVFGSGFDAALGATQLTINGTPSYLTQVQDETLLLTVIPAGATSGPVCVTVAGIEACGAVELTIQ